MSERLISAKGNAAHFFITYPKCHLMSGGATGAPQHFSPSSTTNHKGYVLIATAYGLRPVGAIY